MAVETPTINKIVKMTEFDLLRTNVTQYNMYMCLDTRKLYYDSTNNISGRILYSYIGVKTVNDLLYNITPEYANVYYCWEDNSLWLWMNKWITLWSDHSYPSAYVYNDWNGTSGDLTDVYRNDDPLIPADDNGLLHDGSVVIRDRNRIIKGKLYVDDGNDNLVISSYLGGGVRILPNGQIDTDGEFFISDENDAFIRAKFTVKNNEAYVNYAEVPNEDPSLDNLKKPDHNYKIYHEGNLDASLIQPLTGEAVYNALIADKATLPDPFDFNVKKLAGHGINDFSLVGHTHVAANITDFDQKAQAQAEVVVKSILNAAVGEGITITQATDQTPYKFTANTFNIRLTGGVTGNANVVKLGNVNIATVVDGTKHSHTNYEETMQDLQNQINNIQTIDPNDYYTKLETNALLDDIKGTAVPTAGKPLLVNNNLEFDINVTSANKFKNSKHIELTGDITGSVDTDFVNNTVSITTSAGNILSAVPVSGKALAVDSNGDLPGNATSASELNHTITLNLTNEVSGTATLDTSLNSCSISCTLVPGSNILQSSDLNILVPEMENVGTSANPRYKIKMVNIPDVLQETTIKPQGVFNPNNGVPSQSPVEGYIWQAEAEGTLSGELILEDDFYLYANSKWNLISGNQNVVSVNNKQGRVTINYSDVGGISDSYINYTIGNQVPANKIPVTDTAGHLPGVKVDALTNAFSLLTTNGDVNINTSSSTRTSTDGTQNLNVQLDITQAGYQNILNTIGYVLQNNGVDLTHKTKLNFADGLSITGLGSIYTLKVNEFLNQFNWLYIDDNNTGTIDTSTTYGQGIISALNDLYVEKNTKPTIVVRATSTSYNTVDNNFELYMINDNLPSISGGATTVTIYALSSRTLLAPASAPSGYRQYNVSDNTMTLSFDANADLSSISWSTLTTANAITYLPIIGVDGSTVAYTPTYNAQPANKKYVDDSITGRIYKTTIGDGTSTTFTITHNLGTEDIMVQFRDKVSKQQVYIENHTTNNNTLVVTTNTTVLASNQVQVLITKC